MSYVFLGLLLSASGTVVCMKRTVSSSCIVGENTKRQQRESTSSCDSYASSNDAMGDIASDPDAEELPFTDTERELHHSIMSHNFSRCEQLLVDGAKCLARDPECCGDTALHCAVRHNVYVAEFLVKAKDCLEACNFDGLTPLLLAAQEASSAVELLMQAGADCTYADPETGETALHKLVHHECSLSDLSILVSKYGMNMKARDFGGRTPAMVARNHYHLEGAGFLSKLNLSFNRVYNWFCRQQEKRNGIWQELYRDFVESRSGVFMPVVLTGVVMDYLFFAKPAEALEAAVTDGEQDLASVDDRAAIE